MKYSFYSLILLVVVLTSCNQNNSYSTFKIENSSNHYIYFEVNGQTVEMVAISKGESYLWTVPDDEGSSGWCVSNADSVRIHFDNYNSKVLTYYNHWLGNDNTFNLKRNPINIDFYNEECIREDGCDYTYIITEEDYESAEIVYSLAQCLTNTALPAQFQKWLMEKNRYLPNIIIPSRC
jgi:hypothetical protein